MIYRFFGGKGGVGKTTCAAAYALAAADSGRRMLLVSTDPAHSLGDAFGRSLSTSPRSVTRRLEAIELDADAALERWLKKHRTLLKTIALRGTYLDKEDVDRFLRLSLPGVDELLALVELERVATRRTYDEVVVDTAPTGHTLRLLGTPESLRSIAGILDHMEAKHRFLVERLSRTYTADACDQIIAELDRDGARLASLLRDPARCGIRWVALPEWLAVMETEDALAALARGGFPVSEVILNRVTPAPDRPCALCGMRIASERTAIRRLESSAKGLLMRAIPLLDREPRGVAALRRIGGGVVGSAYRRIGQGPAEAGPHVKVAQPFRAAASQPAGRAEALRYGREVLLRPLRPADLVPDALRLLVVVGKGGVGKTTCAAAVALDVAARHRTRRLLLMSTDPAHSLGDVLGERASPSVVLDRPPSATRLDIVELDAARAFEQKRAQYRQAVDELFDRLRGDSTFDAAHDRQVMSDLIELAPPGLDELVGVLSVIDALFPNRDDAHRLAARGESLASHRDGRGAPRARRDDREYREYLSEEQRSQRGCIARRMQPDFHHGLLGRAAPRGVTERGPYDLVVLDTAPTGHALRLLALPEAAHQWVRTLLAVLLKYRHVTGLGQVSADLLDLSRRLGQLRELLADPAQTRCLVVTRPSAVVRAETTRLVRALGRLQLDATGIVINAVTPPGCSRCTRAARAEQLHVRALSRLCPPTSRKGCAMILAPQVAPPPRGRRALQVWGRTWMARSAGL